ncbi:MAG: hypothetical protein ACOY90_13180 [Candidatus Zhuqueibacterota bacterium]
MILLLVHSNGLAQLDQFHSSGPHFSMAGLSDSGMISDDKKESDDTIREINRFTLSDSLWRMWQAVADSQYVIARKDSIQAEKLFISGAKLAREAFNSIKNINRSEMDSSDVRKIEVKAILHFEQARMYFEQTFKLNPFDIKTQNYLIWIFQNLAELHAHCDNATRAITMLEYLTYIVNDDPGLYYKLSQKYFNAGRWDKALTNIKSAIELLLNDDWNKIDTNYLFGHYYIKSNAEIQLNMIPQALQSLQYAKLIAPTPVEAKRIQQKIDWINWDDGNLTASRRSDQLNYKVQQGDSDYLTIKEEYMDLLNQVTTERAKQDINWKVAQLEYSFLDQKLLAADRMRELAEQIPLDSTGQALRPEDQKYLEDYGMICYNLGQQRLQENDLRSAFVYFFQSVNFQWSGVGKSYLQLSKLTSLDNKSSLKYAQSALALEEQLSIDEKNDLYYAIYLAYKRMGSFDDARQWFQKSSNLTMSR